jgi:nitroreductase
MDVIEAMETCSAARYLRPDPVPQDLIERVIYAATRASSPGNSQEWDFIVVRNPEAKRKIRDLLAPRFKAMGVGVSTTGRITSRMIAGAMHLAETLNEVPAIIFVCGPVAYPPNAPMEQFVWSALYPAAQNLIVAARSVWAQPSRPSTCLWKASSAICWEFPRRSNSA